MFEHMNTLELSNYLAGYAEKAGFLEISEGFKGLSKLIKSTDFR